MPEKRSTLQCRMSPEELASIDVVARWHGVPDRSTAIRILVASEIRRIDRERKKSEKSER